MQDLLIRLALALVGLCDRLLGLVWVLGCGTDRDQPAQRRLEVERGEAHRRDVRAALRSRHGTERTAP